jgi:hypothetical protein
MQVTTLLNPGQNPLAQTIRREVARIISQLEGADVLGTPEALFAAFLADAASKTPGYAGPVLPATQVVVSNAGSVPVKNSAGSKTVTGTATVAAGVLTGVGLAATEAIVSNAQGGIAVTNSAAVAIPGTHTARVAAGLVTRVDLAATVGTVVQGVKQSGWTVTGTGTFFTPTVVAGVCTGGVLSAS